ncbi:MAG TPA: nodulation protein NfeD [Acidimicrobiales bacterium]|nr:nodulation protein NfeD [Acidimicrobiales bacterium]
MRGSGRTASGRWGRRLGATFVMLAGVGLLLGASADAQGSDSKRYALLIELGHPIDTVTARFLSRALDSEEANNAEVVIIRLDTPGGLVDAMRDMVGDIFAASRPVAVFVAPQGARAASAGTFVTAAAGVAAMAPATNIGAAAVVGGQGEDLPDTAAEKATQDAVALLRSIAEQRDRNAEALEETVLDARAFSAEEALDADIIDLIADDVPDLLRQLDGTTIPVGTDEAPGITVETDGLAVRSVDMNLVEQFLSFLANPNIAFLLVSLGGLAIVVELFNFGMVIPGVLGVIMLVLGFTGVGQLPFSWTGVVLIVLAMVFFVAEAQAPGLGVFGALGAVALILGGVFLVGFFGAPEVPGSPTVRVGRWLVAGIGIAAGVAVVWLAWEFRKARRGPGYVSPVARQAIIGQVATVSRRLEPTGEVHFAGEFWGATLPPGRHADEGTPVRIVDVHGYELTVVPVEDGAEARIAGVAEFDSPATAPSPEPSDTPEEGGADGDHQLRQGL